MSKKHFIALADAIREYNSHANGGPCYPFDANQIAALANFCKRQNGDFMRDRWIDYIAGNCGPNGGAR